VTDSVFRDIILYGKLEELIDPLTIYFKSEAIKENLALNPACQGRVLAGVYTVT